MSAVELPPPLIADLRRGAAQEARILRGENAHLREIIAELEDRLSQMRQRDEELIDGARVRTCGLTTPARGTLLARNGEFSWVMFDGCDEPRTWPLKYLGVTKR
ncbi:hypothetical protein MPC4_80180 [Methylocella tundrae]|uniref:Uncharacterized protein n=1 Tax=Methylocella tundrae TaxID=227605 RepID=A0A8B6MD68_METTU|nr:hypothetical protein [Methylocella tundrae]VTZ26735.1 hypothetical protein MPC1_3750002 [Methylocella tundrae]VTZ52509.1 hypothetical protein MPC4_80180 [Methylocella tundrae]